MKFEIQIGDDNIVHSTISCQGEKFARVREGIKMAIQEFEHQLKNQTKCPMHEPEVLQFLYAKTSDDKWVALYNGKVESQMDGQFVGGQYDSVNHRLIDWGSVHNPPRFPTEVPYNPIQTFSRFVLTFENPIPKPWTENDFHLEIDGIQFRIDTGDCDKNGKWTITAHSKHNQCSHS